MNRFKIGEKIMVQFQGFKTKEEAKKFQKENGKGFLTYAYTKSGRKSSTYTDYMFAVNLGGLNAEKYPYCVQWNI